MKSILLATASILAFAGAAAAEVTFGGDATLGYNLDDEDELDDGYDGEQGFFWEANLGVTLSQELDNGLTAAATFTLNIADDDLGSNVDTDGDFLVSLSNEAGGLFFGDTAFAAETHWDTGPISNMRSDGFSEQDSETTLRGDLTYGGVEASVSYVVEDSQGDEPGDGGGPDADTAGLDQLSVGASGAVSNFTFSVAYQEESDAEAGEVEGDYDYTNDFNPDEIFGVAVGTTFSGADIRLAYASNQSDETSSLGIGASYPFGPVTLGAYFVTERADNAADEIDNAFGVTADYASGPITVSAFYEVVDDGNDVDDGGESDDQNDSDFGVEGSYDVGNGLVVRAGYIDSTEGYIGVEQDLGNGTEIFATYAEQDEEGDPEYEEGFTIGVSMEF